jgi:hypothetical protein
MRVLLASCLLVLGTPANKPLHSLRPAITGMLPPTVLLQQAPVLTLTGSQELPERHRHEMFASKAGKYLVIGESDRLEIRDANSLAPIKELSLRWTGFGFDGDDGRLLVVGDDVVLYDTQAWTPVVLGALDDAKFDEVSIDPIKRALKPHQALIRSDLQFYYCTSDGQLALASTAGGKLATQTLKMEWREQHPEPIGQILGTTNDIFLLSCKGTGKAAVGLGNRIYRLMGCDKSFLGALVGDAALCVGRAQEGLYSTRSWRLLDSRGERNDPELKNVSATIDYKTRWVFIGDAQGLRAWSTGTFSTQHRYDQFKNEVSLLAVSSSGPALYTVEKSVLRRWKLKYDADEK